MFSRKGVRVAEWARLESVCTPKGYRGFESLSLRKPTKNPDKQAVYQGFYIKINIMEKWLAFYNKLLHQWFFTISQFQQIHSWWKIWYIKVRITCIVDVFIHQQLTKSVINTKHRLIIAVNWRIIYLQHIISRYRPQWETAVVIF